MMQTQKLINNGDAAVDEMLTGILAAHPGHLWRPDHAPRAVIARHGPRPGKVALVIGGGSGHEPTFLGFVGKGLADACAVGNVFASPPPQPAVDAALAANGGAGVLFIYGNYAGDVMNFDMACELLEMEGVEARTVLTTDDIASHADRSRRRGVAGNVFIFKTAGAAADLMLPLDQVERIARHANARTFTMGVALSSCSLPQTRRPSFDLPAGQMEIGMGIHGEPGVRRGPLRPADEVVDEIMAAILSEMRAPAGDRVAVLVNSLGATPLMELYILHARVTQRLSAAGLTVAKVLVGPYCTSLDMAGASITVMHLDETLERLLNHPCDCAMFRQG
jgi:dihydroxyacetone kinase-like protein